MKKCEKCKISQPLTDFCKCKVYADGHARRCKKCANQYRIDHAEYFKQYNIDNASKMTEYQKQYRKDNIVKMTAYLKQYRLNKKKRRDNILEKYETVQKSIEGKLIKRLNTGIWRIIKKITSLRSK